MIGTCPVTPMALRTASIPTSCKAMYGIVATMPYIALQLVGIEAVLKAMGVTGHVPIIVAFAILAAYTYNSGLRAPALIAFVKDALIYVVIIVAVIVIPYKLGGWDAIFGAAEAKFEASPNPGDGVILAGPAQLQYCLLYTSDAADDLLCVDLGGRRI